MRKFKIIGISVLMVMILAACATGTKGKLVSSYELAGISLKAALDVAKPACDVNQLPVDKCVQIKKFYNDARSVYLLAGDSLIIAVETDNLVKRQAALQEYQNLSILFTKNTTDIINILIQLGVIKSK